MKNFLKKESILILLLLIVVLGICFYDVVLLGKTFKVTTSVAQAFTYGVYGQADNKPPFFHTFGVDSAVLEEPAYEFISRNLRQGIFPLWNPHQACGYPIISLIYYGFFFPLTFIAYFFPQLIAWDIMIFARFLLAGLFTYWLMRTFRIDKKSSFISAVIFMLSGPLVLIQNFSTDVDIITPLLLLALERFIHNTNGKNFCLVALSCALTFFAGHPEHIFFVNLFGLLFLCFRVFSLENKINTPKVLYRLLGAYLLGLGLSAVATFPFFNNFTSQFWNGHPEGMGLMIEEHRGRLLAIAMPYFFENVPMNNNWTTGGWWGGYIGVLPLGLAFISLFRKQKKGLNYFFVILGTLIIGKSFGWPIINWIGHLPLLRMCRFAFHSPSFVALSMAIAAGMGVRVILTSRKSGLFAGIYSLFLLFFIGLNYFQHKAILDSTIAGKAVVIAVIVLLFFNLILLLRYFKIIKQRHAVILIAALIITELFLYIPRARARRFDSFPKVPYIEFLKNQSQPERSYGNLWAFFPNTATGYGVDDLGIFEGLILQRFETFINTFIQPGNFVPDLRPTTFRAMPLQNCKPFADMLNIRYVVFPGEQEDPPPAYLQHENLKKVYATKDIKIFERQDAFPRAFIVHRAIFEEKKEAALLTLKSIWPDLNTTAVLSHKMDPAIARQLNQSPKKDQSQAEILKYTPNEVIIQANMENAGLLVLSDTYHFDWQAYIDGKKTEIFPTNYLIRSVFLPAGRHKVRFAFEPASFYWGLATSLASLIILLFVFFNPKSKRQY